MKLLDLEGVIEGILFVSGEPVSISRLSLALDTDERTVTEACVKLRDMYEFGRRGIRLVFIEKAVQLCSSPEYAESIRLALEVRKPPTLSQQALEVLAIIAYFQPVTKTYIEQIRGVDSAYIPSARSWTGASSKPAAGCPCRGVRCCTERRRPF
jgi:segregation and condensation protein B